MEIVKYRAELDKDRHNILVMESVADYGCESLQDPDKIVSMLNAVYGLNRLAEEHVYMIALTTKCMPLGVFEISHGTVNISLFSTREIFIRLLLCGASMFVIAHNHPSGDISPTDSDAKVTKRLKECAGTIGIDLIDHIIVGSSYYSFKEHGML